MINKLFEKMLEKTLQFSEQEDGLALTEYLILLGVIAGGLIVLVGAFGTDLGSAYSSMTDNVFGASGLNTQ
jgi:Flp pilus assembly pilin Flp